VRKTLMVEGFHKIFKYKNVLEILSTIKKNQGFKGFYKGFSLPPLVVYAPSTMLWWKIYNTSQRFQKEEMSLREKMTLQAFGKNR
jgi:hypothetical protein